MVYIIIIFIIIVIDYITKFKINEKMNIGEKKEIVEDKFYIWHIKNKGIAYNKFEKYPEMVICITSVAITGFFIYLLGLIRYPRECIAKFSLSLVIGGAMGNLIDRIRNKNVTDFIYLKGKNTPIFNFADIFIVFGAVLFVFSSVFQKNNK